MSGIWSVGHDGQSFAADRPIHFISTKKGPYFCHSLYITRDNLAQGKIKNSLNRYQIISLIDAYPTQKL